MSTTNFLGVRCTKSGRYEAFATVNSQRLYFGTFDTPEEAAMARDAGVLQHCDPPVRGTIELNYPTHRMLWLVGGACNVQIPAELAKTFHKRLTVTDGGCWECKSGHIYINKKGYTPRNISWAIEYGVMLNEGPFSKCGNNKCVNPEHLFNPTVDHHALQKHETHKSKAISAKLSKLTKLQRQAIKDSNKSLSTLAKKYGVSRTTISNVRSGK